MENLLVTIPEACAMTRLGRSYMYQLLAKGEIRSVKTGKKRLIDVTSLKEWIAQLPSDGITPSKRVEQ